MHAAHEPPRTLRGGRYVLGEVLGEGGMAVVCRATDTELGVERAIKVVYPGHASRESLRRRLRDEARAMARLHHPNILGIHDVGNEDDYDWVVMDLAAGGSLRDRQADGPLPPVDAIRVMIQVLSALATAHAAGIVHRDVKPHNILLDASGRPLLADFGIALLMGDDRRTRSGVAMGSLAYMPPEQRIDAAKVGPAADIYASGTTLYDLITGNNPVDLFLAPEGHSRWDPVPEALRPILRRACAARPTDRYPDAGSMAHDLLQVLEQTHPEELAAMNRPRFEYPAPSNAFSDKSMPTVPPGGDAAVRAAMTFLDQHVVMGPSGPTLAPDLESAVAVVRTPTVGADDPTLPPPVVGPPHSTGRRGAALVALALLLLGGLLVGVWVGRPGPSQDVAAHEEVSTDGAVAPIDAGLEDDVASTEEASGELPAEIEPGDPGDPVEPAPPVAPTRAPSTDPAPVAAPRVPEPEPVAGGTADVAPPFGRWTGSKGGVRMTLVLSGMPDAVTGSFTSSTLDGVSLMAVPVSGTARAVQGVTRVVVTEQGEDEGTYDLVLRQAGDDWRLEGDYRGGVQRAVSLKWAP